MHNCEEFRERITERIIDREDLAATAELQHELLICSGCSDFYAESREMIEALSAVDLSISESQWNAIEGRLRWRIANEDAGVIHHKGTKARRVFLLAPLLAAAALLLITIGLARLAIPSAEVQLAVDPAPQSTYIDHSAVLDPVTVDFLEQSELLLRNVMKIAPSDAEDLADAKKTASEQLVDIKLRKEAAADVPPVVDVMETYETILRDLRNLDDRNAAEDIPDIQKRIQKNGLIANMKAFQPNLMQVSFGLH
jgi:hypothetical protein